MTVTFLNRKARQNSARTLRRKIIEASASLQPCSNGHASTPMATRTTHKSLLQLAAQEDRRKCTKSAENPPSPPLSIFGKSRHFDALRVKTVLESPFLNHSTSGFRRRCLSTTDTPHNMSEALRLTYNSRRNELIAPTSWPCHTSVTTFHTWKVRRNFDALRAEDFEAL